uniref:N-terminal methionine N(alpha)-acetyltransferase NatC n=1 Tax=Arion vulgaris TaxID=1028688 RepID=A0A0B6ZXG7_9EUPU
MADRMTSVSCSPQKSEPSLISPATGTHNLNHHGHLRKGDRDEQMCSKSYNVAENNDQCNGSLHFDADGAFSESSAHTNVLKIANIDDHHDVSCDSGCVHHHDSLICHSQSVSKTKCLEKVNGLTHNVPDHSSGVSHFVVNLQNISKTEEGDVESHSCNEDSLRMSQLRQADSVSYTYDEIKVDEVKKCLHEELCSNEHICDVEGLASKLGSSSLYHHSNSNELLASNDVMNSVNYLVYESEKHMPLIMRLITKDLSEPYSIYTYRYFIHNWPKLCFLATADNKCVGAIVCKLDLHKKMVRRGYIAMLAVDSEYRRRQIGSTLVTKAIQAMMRDDCDEVVLETEITNQGALRLYENLGFVRDKRLFRYYLNGVDALRLKLWLR